MDFIVSHEVEAKLKLCLQLIIIDHRKSVQALILLVSLHRGRCETAGFINVSVIGKFAKGR
jgi:hypothetical protein